MHLGLRYALSHRMTRVRTRALLQSFLCFNNTFARLNRLRLIGDFARQRDDLMTSAPVGHRRQRRVYAADWAQNLMLDDAFVAFRVHRGVSKPYSDTGSVIPLSI